MVELQTKTCPICGISLEGHPECDACGILTGIEHLSTLRVYRKHKLCEHCIDAWKKKEFIIDRTATFEEFKYPREKIGGIQI
jgi:hypothetical protein